MAVSLDSLQRRFAESLLDNGEAERRDVLAELRTTAQTATSAERDVDEVTRQRRFDLYRHSVRSNRRAALANAYPVLLALVGDAYFYALSRAYAREHPSQSGDLNRFGAALPGFVERYETDPRYRYFADLARLEWALHTAHFAADAATLSAPDWTALSPADLLDTPLVTHPACTPIASRYAIAAIWAAHQPNGSLGQAQAIDSPTYALVVRPQWRAEIREQSAAAHAAFCALQRGATLNEALDSAFEIDAGFDFPTQWRAWIASAAITGPARGAPRQTGFVHSPQP